VVGDDRVSEIGINGRFDNADEEEKMYWNLPWETI